MVLFIFTFREDGCHKKRYQSKKSRRYGSHHPTKKGIRLITLRPALSDSLPLSCLLIFSIG